MLTNLDEKVIREEAVIEVNAECLCISLGANPHAFLILGEHVYVGLGTFQLFWV